MSIICTCIGCGCDDLHACGERRTRAGCSWLIKDGHIGLGVCSSCPDEAKRWHTGDRRPSRKALLGEALHIIKEERHTLHYSCSIPGTNRIPNADDRAELRKLDRWIRFTKEAMK
jgi:hypothetical protein